MLRAAGLERQVRAQYWTSLLAGQVEELSQEFSRPVFGDWAWFLADFRVIFTRFSSDFSKNFDFLKNQPKSYHENWPKTFGDNFV